MAEGERRPWSREEVLRALSLYCVLPFGKFHKSNPDVVALALALGRTPSSVSMKLCNLASFDPQHKARGVGGMANASRLDREVWEEYHGRWEDLAAALPATAAEEMDIPEFRLLQGPTTQERVVQVRRGQQFFRRAVLAAYDGRCCITGIAEPALLRASHIVPWAESAEHRLDPSNGLCLNALHDAAFDQNLLTLDEQLRVRLSPLLCRTVPADAFAPLFGRFDGKPIREPERFAPAAGLLVIHRRRLKEA